MKGAIKMKMFDNNYKLLDEMYQDATILIFWWTR